LLQLRPQGSQLGISRAQNRHAAQHVFGQGSYLTSHELITQLMRDFAATDRHIIHGDRRFFKTATPGYAGARKGDQGARLYCAVVSICTAEIGTKKLPIGGGPDDRSGEQEISLTDLDSRAMGGAYPKAGVGYSA
jgi:hypothetical protein